MKKLTLLLLAVFALCVQDAMAWGGWAHKLIAHTADRYLEPEVKSKVEKYLGSPIMDHATWMDWVRKPIRNKKHPEHDYYQPLKATVDWHMVTVDENMQISDKRAYNGCGDLLPNLKLCIENLKNHRNLTDSAVVVNLKCAIHMIEDMHCPSHIYYTEFPDCFRKPGSKYRRDCFSLTYEGKKRTYHGIWDGDSILTLYPDFGKDYDLFRDKLDNLSAKKRAKMCEGTVDEWVVESAKDCRKIYDWAGPGDVLDRSFLLSHRKLSILQYHRASYRLAHILNECFK